MKISFAKAFIVANWIAACGLFVSSQLIMQKYSILPAKKLDEILFNVPLSERPEMSSFIFADSVGENDGGLPRVLSNEDIRARAKDWRQYALKLENRLDLAKASLESRRARITRISVLFWIAFGLVAINALWSTAYVLGGYHSDKKPASVPPSA